MRPTIKTFQLECVNGHNCSFTENAAKFHKLSQTDHPAKDCCNLFNPEKKTL